MLSFILRRIVMALPTLAIVALTVFFLMRLIPGDPVIVMLGDMAQPDMIEEYRRSLGLDRPMPIQFMIWLANVLQGDFGYSIVNKLPVLDLMLDRFQVTASVVIISVALASLLAVPAGVLAAWRQGGLIDLATVSLSSLLVSIPSFWLGLLILMLFGLTLNWLPIVGYISFSESPVSALAYLVMPVTTLVFSEMGFIARMTRSSMIEVMRLEYITHARAKGLSESAVLWRHAFPNAFAPTWTVIGLILGNLLGGVAVVETVFTLPGLGRLLVESIYARDYPVVQGCLLLVAGVYVVINLVVDLLYPLFDPRVAE
ncbi:ABC transporter permease [Mesorhizobium kowhaii]|uniref:Peptide ABC transporter n=1 Tax=Mesorhizobium kowhaii TaxID=1300272 RepID=A0A2W7C0M0_9HYPH|nr:ABC transporter permease [Mesorhizobium kowhaii]PZV36384.1 peptide ABC transporter [Mesorhizobium kowhaii]